MTTVALTEEQYMEIITTMREGTNVLRPNDRIATALIVEAQLGVRISDIVRAESRKKGQEPVTTQSLRLCDIVQDGKRRRLNLIEQKTKKRRTFTVQEETYNFLCGYAMRHGIGVKDELFPFTVRAVQKHLKAVCDLLGYENISTHSFRKMFCTRVYELSGHDIIVAQTLMQHSSPDTTRRYILLSEERIENTLAGYNALI